MLREALKRKSKKRRLESILNIGEIEYPISNIENYLSTLNKPEFI